VAVAAIVALGAACLAGSPLYLSSVGSAAVQNELRHSCLADVSLIVPMGGAQPDSIARLEKMVEPIAEHTQPSVVTRIAPDLSVDTGDPTGKLITAHLVYRDGQEQNLLRPVKPVGDGEVLAPEWMSPPAGTKPGDKVTLLSNDNNGKLAWKRTFTVVDTYPRVPTRPESAYWCGLRKLFRSSSNDPADPPTPVLLTTSDDIREAEAFRVIEWEVRPNPVGLSRHDAAVLADQFNAIGKEARRSVDVDEAFDDLIDGEPLKAVVRHAGASTAVVAGTMAPVRLVGLLSSLSLLGSATALVTRERQRELRLRLLKGESPWSLGFRVARGTAGAVATGIVVGGFLALAAVRFFGPASELETAAVRSAVEYALVGAVVAFVVIAIVAAGRARTFVDSRMRHCSWARIVPWEVIPVAAAMVTYSRLDRIGGIQQVGARVAHSDFWAQSFPLLAILAPLAVLARPTIALLRRWRLAGKHMPLTVMTGLRRSLAEPGITAAVLLATALAAGSFTLAQLLTDSTASQLSEKAAVFLGSDLELTTRDITTLPAPFDKTGTIVTRSQGRSGSQSVDLLGIDHTTFALAVHWRDDAADRPLADLVNAVGTDDGSALPDAVPAIVVGGTLPSPVIKSLVLRPMTIDPVATARWFPGFRNGAIMVIVDKDLLKANGFSSSSEIWLRDPPFDAETQLADAGVLVRSPRDLSTVFDVTSFVTVRWAYATLSILGVLVGIVVLLAQLLVLDARRQTRQASHVLTTRMGLTSRGEAIGLIAELGPALVVGAALGVAIGWTVTKLSVVRLDSLRQLKPPARVIAHPAAGLPVLVGVLVSLAVLVVVGFVMIKRTRAMEVMRGTA
jgi:putative ABC transport system permease protein